MSSAEIDQLRRLTNEPVDETEYDDAELQSVIDASVDIYAAAAQIWREKAAVKADMVNTTEGNSRRDWSKAYEQALAMAKTMEDQSDANDPDPTAGQPTARMRKIIRT